MNRWTVASSAAFAVGDLGELVGDRCAKLGAFLRRRLGQHAGEEAIERVEREARDLAELGRAGAVLLALKGAIVAGEAAPFWAGLAMLQKVSGHVRDGCEAKAATGCRCLLMAGHERRGYPLHLDRHFRQWL